MKRRKKLLIAVPLALVLIITLSYGLFEVSTSRTFQFFGKIVSRVETDKKVVALTFDDAPTEYTQEVLEKLQEKKIKATFYAIGNEIQKHPKEARQIVVDGMEVGNHSYSHPRFYFQSQSEIDYEIQSTNKLIRKSGYQDEITFRPPYGKKMFGLPWYLAQNNITTITWDVEPDTYIDTTLSQKEQTDQIVKYTLEKTRNGSIILLHPFCKTCQSDRDAIIPIIDELKKHGYTFVTVSELLILQQ